MYNELLRRLEDSGDQLPVEVESVVGLILGLNVVDEIDVRPMTNETLDGLFQRRTYRPTIYGDPVTKITISYADRLAVPAQRLVCCKELVHTFDPPISETKDVDTIAALIEKLTADDDAPVSGLADYQAILDRFAVYRAYPILMPMSLRSELYPQFEAGEITYQDVARIACVPIRVANLVMEPDWPDIYRDICKEG